MRSKAQESRIRISKLKTKITDSIIDLTEENPNITDFEIMIALQDELSARTHFLLNCEREEEVQDEQS